MTDQHAGDAEPSTPEAPQGMPRWVKVTLLVTLAVLVLFAIVHLATGGARNGPARHGMGATTSAPTATL